MKNSPMTTDKPAWLKMRIHGLGLMESVEHSLRQRGLHTICEEGNCPNRQECFSRREASLLIMGDTCTRFCRFCGVRKGQPQPLDLLEPQRVAEEILDLGLKFVVITSVTRDDLPDGGAAHFVQTLRAIRKYCPGVGVELLVPDFAGSCNALEQVLAAQPQVLSHNIETVPRLYPQVRRGADYKRSLNLLAHAASHRPRLVTKSSLMLGLGESLPEVVSTLADLREASCEVITLGQYLSPSPRHHPVAAYLYPDEFERYKEIALSLGFKAAASAPLVRSSYQAGELYRTAREGSPPLSPTPTIPARLLLSEHLPYQQALGLMRDLADKVRQGEPAAMIVCEHEPVLTLGRHGDPSHILVDQATLKQRGIAVHQVERGGQVTYHGPGQVMIYPILRLAATGLGISQLVRYLEQATIETLAHFEVASHTRKGLPGVWVGEDKIASIGMAIKDGVTLHGLAVNNNPDLAGFELINPCGLAKVRMTSITQIIGSPAPPDQLGRLLADNLAAKIGLFFAIYPENARPCCLAPVALKLNPARSPQHK